MQTRTKAVPPGPFGFEYRLDESLAIRPFKRLREPFQIVIQNKDPIAFGFVFEKGETEQQVVMFIRDVEGVTRLETESAQKLLRNEIVEMVLDEYAVSREDLEVYWAEAVKL